EVCPVAQILPQTPRLHVLPVQRAPHVPQLASSMLVFTSQPLPAAPSQLAKPGLHAPSAHTPPAQVEAALAAAQRRPAGPQGAMAHAAPPAPQLKGLLVRSRHSSPQAAVPGGQREASVAGRSRGASTEASSVDASGWVTIESEWSTSGAPASGTPTSPPPSA